MQLRVFVSACHAMKHHHFQDARDVQITLFPRRRDVLDLDDTAARETPVEIQRLLQMNRRYVTGLKNVPLPLQLVRPVFVQQHAVVQLDRQRIHHIAAQQPSLVEMQIRGGLELYRIPPSSDKRFRAVDLDRHLFDLTVGRERLIV